MDRHIACYSAVFDLGLTVAVFNSREEEQTISFENADIGLSDGLHETEYVWDGRRERLRNYTFALKPHQSILLKIKK